MADKEKLEVQVTTQGADRAAKELDKVSQKADELDNKKIDLGGLTDLVGPGGLVAALGVGIGAVVEGTANAAIEADNLASLTGDSVEQTSRLNAVWKQTGADTKDLQDVLLQMNGVLATNTDIAKQLGINLDDGATVGQRFEQVAAALDKIPDAARRSQIASQVFGEEGVRQYNALRQAVGDVGEAMQNVAEGQVFDDEDVRQAREMKQQLAEVKGELIGFANTAGKIALPVVNDLIDGFKEWFANAEEAGASLRRVLTGGPITTEAQKQNEAFRQSEEAARDFDRALLDGLTTFDQVHAAVLQHTGDLTAANIVAVEWSNTQKTLPPVIDAVTEALNKGDESWQKYRDAQAEGLAVAEGAPGTFGEMAAAADAAVPSIEDLEQASKDAADRGLSILSAAAQAVGDALDESFGDLEDDLGSLDLLDDIKDQFDAIEEAQKNATDDKGVRDLNREIRRLQGQLLDYLRTVDDIPPDKVTEIIAQIRTGDIETLERTLDELTRDRFINVGIAGATTPGFTSGNVDFNPLGGTLTPTFNGVTSPVDNRNITIIYPVGSTPTTQYIDGVIDQRRNGTRNPNLI